MSEKDEQARWKRLAERSGGHAEGGDLGFGSGTSQNGGQAVTERIGSHEVNKILLTTELTSTGEKCVVIPKGILVLNEGMVFGFAIENDAMIHESDKPEEDKVNVKFPDGLTKKFDRRGLAEALRQYFREVASTE